MGTVTRSLGLLAVVCLLVFAQGCLCVSQKKYDSALRRSAQCEENLSALTGENSDLLARNQQLSRQNAELVAQLEAGPRAAEIDKKLQDLYERMKDLADKDDGLVFTPDNVLSFSDILFDFAKADLRPEGAAAVKKVAKELKASGASVTVRIDGHTDNVPVKRPETKKKFKDLWGLSGARARTVLNALEKEGIRSIQMYFRGFSDTRPVKSNSTKEGRQANRRVEISFVTTPAM